MKKLILCITALLWSTFTFADSIFIESFEYANHDNETPIGWTCDDQSWLCGYLEKDHNRIPHTGNWYAYTNAEESWMFMPLYFSSELRYRFSCWAISDGNYDLEFWAGDNADPSQMIQCFSTFNINGSEYEKYAIYVESILNNYEYLGIRAIAHEGAQYLTIDDIYIDVVVKYEFTATPYSADTVLYPGSQATHHFDVHNLGYIPIEVIFHPSNEYFSDFHFYVDGTSCSSFHLEPDEVKHVVAEATLLPTVPAGSTCWLDIQLLLDCDCATSMTTLWVTVLDPTEMTETDEKSIISPNPANNHVTIQGKGLQQVEVFDYSGKKIITTPADQDLLQLDLSPLASGVYFVRTIAAKGTSTYKIVKQ